MSSLIQSSGLTDLAIPQGKLTSSVSGNALTVKVTDANGNDPSSISPLFTSFPTDSTGSLWEGVPIVSPLSVTISFGSTLGAASGHAPFKLWVLLFRDLNDVLRLGVIKCTDSSRTKIYSLVSLTRVSLADGGAGAADSAGVAFTDVATVGARPYRIVGFLEWTNGLTVAGRWDVDADNKVLYRSGMPRPGETVQRMKVNPGAVFSNTTTIPLDNTPPLTAEGTQITQFNCSMVSEYLTNFLDYHAEISVSHHTGACYVIAAMLIDGGPSATVANAVKIPAADDFGVVVLDVRMFPSDSSSHGYVLAVGGSAAGTWTVAGQNGAGLFGATLPSFTSIEEIMT